MGYSYVYNNRILWEDVFHEDYNIVTHSDTNFTVQIDLLGTQYHVIYTGTGLLSDHPAVAEVSVVELETLLQVAEIKRFPLPGPTADDPLTQPLEQLHGEGRAAFEKLLQNATRLEEQVGSEDDDLIIGFGSRDALHGRGGNDTLVGSGGQDQLNGGDGFDFASYAFAGAGVTASLANAALGTGAATGVWHRTIEGLIGTHHDDTLFGDPLDNHLIGGNGRDALSGASGNDTLDGGSGIDTAQFRGNHADYDITNAGNGSWLVRDRISGRDGSDLISEIELLQFADLVMAPREAPPPPPPPPAPQPLLLRGTSRADVLTGGALNDTIYGGNGNDRVSGGNGDDRLYGGGGKDVLAGGLGRDVFVFNTRPNARSNVDKIVDFNVVNDAIWLENKVFKSLGKKGSETLPAKLKKAFFTVGTEAKDRNDFLIYNKKNGTLFYDADGNGEGRAVQIATLPKKLKLAHNDFLVI